MQTNINTKNKFIQFRKKHGIFYVLMLAVPVIQFLIFYVGVNFNSILFAFQDYNYDTGRYELIGVQQFVKIFEDFKTLPYLWGAVGNSFIALAVNIFTLFLGTFFSYYIYKKNSGGGFFKIILFLPAMISTVSLAMIFRYFFDRAYPEIILKLMGVKPTGLFSSEKTSFFAVLLYCVFIGFSSQILLLLGGMEGISPSVIESGQIDGVTPFREFISIVIPMIYPTMVTFLVVQVGALFTNQANLYTFYQGGAEYSVYTMGYYLYKKTLGVGATTLSEYPYLSALGLILTIISVPVTFTVKWALEKFGPDMEGKR